MTATITTIRILTAGLLALSGMPAAQAESLFRANAQYNDNQPMPRSLYFQPAPRFVGDLVTIQLAESTTNSVTANVKITRTNALKDTSTDLLNNAVKQVLQKIPVVSKNFTGKLANTLSIPSFNGVNDSQNVQSQATTDRQSSLQDTITCQVTQVLSNGNLVVQGHKTVLMNKEESTLYVSGIVNPYYLDRNNQIASSKVGNFQIQSGGQGVISRQQTDGVASKLYHVFH